MIFGFPNGTDFTMDISPYLMDTGYYTAGNDLVTRLLQNLTIDNNIFGFKSTNQIKINYLPEQLLLYDTSGNQLFADNFERIREEEDNFENFIYYPKYQPSHFVLWYLWF